ncbi:MAG: PIN domain-containing protein [bacterium]
MLTYLDANVLIWMSRGDTDSGLRALTILNEPLRRFASSPFLQLETLPLATFNRRTDQVEILNGYFQTVDRWASINPELIAEASAIAVQYGLAAMDALHLASAIAVGAEEFVTAERPTRRLCQVPIIRVRSIHPDAS